MEILNNETLLNENTICTNWRPKNTSRSIYLNLENSNYNDSGIIKIEIIGKKADESEHNCACGLNEYYLELGKKYELYNMVYEMGCIIVQLKFLGRPGQTIRGRWPPDFVMESGCIVVNGGEYPHGGPPATAN